MRQVISQQLSKLPDRPGVYLFRDKTGKVIYIGKAKSIIKRVKSYFQQKPFLLPRIERMVSQIFRIDFIETKSEIEALLLESSLIKRQRPKYNVEWKDDKNYLYIKIEKKMGNKNILYPRICTVRKPQDPESIYFGPFTDAEAVKKTLAFLRRIFPYRTCRNFPKSPCLLYHLKRCPGPCIQAISVEEYQKIIHQITLFLENKLEDVLSVLEQEMEFLSKNQKFEQAALMRDRIEALKHINKVSVLRKDFDSRAEEGLKELIKILKIYYPELLIHSSFKIEAYDVSNISGTAGTGSMVVFIDGEPKKDEYRRFAIKTVSQINDVACMEEVLRRRFRHKDEWLLPDLIVLDGGKGQLKAAQSAQEAFHINIPCIALAKQKNNIYTTKTKQFINLPQNSPALLLIQRIRDEAHRFAKSYHIKRRHLDFFQ